MSKKLNLTKKVGPLPLWAWIAAAAFVVVLAWYIRHRAAQDVPVNDSRGVDPGLAPSDSAVGLTGSGVGNLGNGTGSFDPEAYQLDVTAITDAFQAQLDALAAGLSTPAHVPTPLVVQSPAIFEPAAAPVTAAPQPVPVLPASVAVTPVSTQQTSFEWGGQTWGHGDKQRFIQWLNAHGASYPLWVLRHPKAAHDVFGEAI